VTGNIFIAIINDKYIDKFIVIAYNIIEDKKHRLKELILCLIIYLLAML